MDLIGKTFTVQVADGDALYEVTEQATLNESLCRPCVELVYVEHRSRSEYDYQGVFGDGAWVEATAIEPLVKHNEWVQSLRSAR